MDEIKYNTDEMEEINSAFHDKDFVRIMLLKFGICDKKTLDAISFADDEAIHHLLNGMFLSEEFIKLMKYLRS